MTKGHRLGHLQMGKARHYPIRARLGLHQQRLDQRQQRPVRRIALVADPQPEIDGNLIVPRPGGVQPARRFTDDFLQPRLDIHVNILKCGRKTEISALDL